ncbi:hypothetical protein [Vibrio parahaemolyticus]|uniref:hypothetical protein n=1 Tax=Vibrio parahaemolyticus TaxID=670 RepID=UPI0004DFB356|nr:hypothetical protein [Vibrio parahaemolyticus]EHV5558145.1 hypothetical protein [Vibrio parahaemolyticus]ELB2105491.1 hypothetical protein [Vibrio parahaemolyticus]ELB2132030.1 hypothetical protein [Vibrio parahaemolyticus]ELB2146943.1 hypothetical protein [Vibrio parahaemolyticus]ELB2239333.1 hypothetical protein [Vibrio parahaemolyticus]
MKQIKFIGGPLNGRIEKRDDHDVPFVIGFGFRSLKRCIVGNYHQKGTLGGIVQFQFFPRKN